MALPFILSLLGSGLAGAGALGTGILASPLIAGAVGAGLGKTFETGNLGEGIKTGLTAGLLGGIGGALVGGGAAAAGAAPAVAGAAVPAAAGAAVPAAAGAAPAGVLGSGATSFRQALGAMPAGTSAVAAVPDLAFRDLVRQGLNQGVLTGAGLGTALPGLMEASQPKPMEVPESEYIPEAEPFYRELLRYPKGYRPGIDPEFAYFSPSNYGARRMAEGGEVARSLRTGEPIETGLAGMMNMISRGEIDPDQMGGMGRFFGRAAQAIMNETGEGSAPASTTSLARRVFTPPPEDYRPGVDPEWMYSRMVPRAAGGGTVKFNSPALGGPVYMFAGGIADAMPGVEMVNPIMIGEDDEPEMNDKDIVKAAVSAIRGEIPEEEAAIVLGMFLQSFGEEALRRLVSDVRTGKVDGERGDIEGMIEGPGDGMDDLVPAEMDDGSQDVLLSDGEFIVPADVVSGLGNGSTDAGAEELYNMMDRVREERTGMTEQPAQVKVGGLLPA